jgi:uncharacterized protein (DUF362 family)
VGLVAAGVGGLRGLTEEAEAAQPTIAVASKREPAALVKAAVDALGGMRKFVKKGDVVLVKPNIGWARRPEVAATTNPAVLSEIIRLCKAAGAREVLVMDHPVDRPDALVLKMTGLEEAARKAGARAVLASSLALYQKMSLPKGKVLRSVDVMRDLRRADVVINAPVAKVHNSTVLTLGLKNMMGTVWDRGAFHRSDSLDQAIADYALAVRPKLVILDAVRILLSNGPAGPGKTADRRLVVAGTDALAVDAYGATLFGRKPEQIGHLRCAHASGVGEIDLRRVKILDV